VTRRWAATGAALAVAVLAACSGGDDASGPTAPPPTDAVILQTTTSTTEAPITGEPLVVVDQGVSTFPDPFDPGATLGGYGVIVENPNPEAMAAGVHISTRILDAAGTELLVDRALLNAVMPGARMAVGRTLIEPIEEPTHLEVTVEVTAWLRPSSPDGATSVDGVVTEPEANGGAITRFTVHSTWPQIEEGVDVTAVYRAEDGRILAAESTTLASVPPDADTPGQIRLLSPIPSLAATEVYVGRGIAAQTAG
jgi:hypothetical protein